ncbi:MAG: oxidoreductase [Acidimicrobiaceae bacterium]|nr:oxidoreductase [Acidimicrobiaceae bacterium]|tara:strand:- start:7753 stop:8736 length:984 start_codon:yes stop_codon:yes gene_type:complete
MTFRAVLLSQADKAVSSEITELDESQLPDGNVTVDVTYSTLNYKDGMILNGVGRLVRDYPHVPGIDFSGVVSSSSDDRYAQGDRVVLTGWRVGEAHWGGYSEKARVNADWLVKLPEGLSELDAMSIGTAGLTSMLAMQALEKHGVGTQPVLVTGAAGGVGSVAVHLLAQAGYEVAASTGRPETSEYLKKLGATQIVSRQELAELPSGPLSSERWGGCIDAVGDTTLAHVLTEMQYGSSVAACGLAGGNALDTTVIPFLLRGVNLLGIDSVMCPFETRVQAWQRLDELLDREVLSAMTTTVGLEEVPQLGSEILAGKVQGRTVVDLNI